MALSFLLGRRLFSAPSAEMLYERYSQSGNSAYLAELMACCGDDLYYFLLKQSDIKTAEDVCQQTWLKVLEGQQRFLGKSSFKTWLFSIGRNGLVDEFRRQQRWQFEQCEEDALSVTDNTWCNLLQQQQKLAFEQQLALLPFVQREAIILQLEGFTLSEIALITGEPIETIKSRLRYARQHLKQFYGAEHD